MREYPVPKIVFYSHDTMGLGHVRRNLLLASELLAAMPETEVLLISGVHESGSFNLPKGADIITLPTYFKSAEGEYLPRSLGRDVQRLTSLRADIIQAAMKTFKPDVFIVDNVPRGAMSELDSVLPILVKNGTHLVLGLRDIVDDPATVRRQWDKLNNIETIRNYFSSIWIYGDKSFYNLAQAYRFDGDTCQKISFLGYLDATRRPRQQAKPQAIVPGIRQPYALCLVGGGQDGVELATTFANATFPTGMMGVLITGSMMPAEQREELQRIAAKRHDLLVVRFVAEPLELLRQAECLVAMGGYNTTTEILSFHKRALIVPRVTPRQEQWLRASRLAEMQLVSCLHPDHLSLPILNHWLAEQSTPQNPRHVLNFNGLGAFTHKVKALFQSSNAVAKTRQETFDEI
ncbi:glycosyltransferase family protein [Serratia sp. (in: enterobacteria)]|uniref:glycosyltransferase family protein n=1 Tax=Serratia sp. (in: enterobacteria) TaxID=616 RepID=UPI003989AA78